MDEFIRFVAAVIFIVGPFASGVHVGSTSVKEEILKDKKVCYGSSDSGMKFEKCFDLVERKGETP